MNIKESKIITMLPPSKGNPRNSEGSFLKLDDGRIAFAFSRYTGDSFNDHASCEIACIYSYDNGESFDTENIQTLVNASEFGQTNVMSVTLRRMKNGDIGLFFLVKLLCGGLRSEMYLRRFKGDFSNMTGQVKVVPQNYTGYYVVNNDRVILLSSGRWMVLGSYYHTYQGFVHDGESKHDINYRGVAYCFTSDDDGMTWRQHNAFLALNGTYSNSGLAEPGCIELPGGIVYSYFRTDLSYQYESFSFDGGETWTPVQPSRFTSPESPMLIAKNEKTGIYYCVRNPVPRLFDYVDKKAWTGGRTPLVISDSADGRNFSKPIVLEDCPDNGYCYPAIYFLDDGMLLAYCSGGQEEGSCLNRITIRKLILE